MCTILNKYSLVKVINKLYYNNFISNVTFYYTQNVAKLFWNLASMFWWWNGKLLFCKVIEFNKVNNKFPLKIFKLQN